MPEQLQQIALKALSRDVAQRYAWASEIAEDLRRFLGSGAGAEGDLGEWLRRVCTEEFAAEQLRAQPAAAPVPEAPEHDAPARDPGGADESGTRFEEVLPPKA